ncbi:MAG: ATP-binding protein [Actinomycetota bacterium]|nr:GAF domain-containing protein [Actinomycetota bacterium]
MKRSSRQVDAAPPPVALQNHEVAALLEASRAAGDSIDLPVALRSILDAALGLVSADEGSIQLLDPDSQTLWIAAAKGIPDDIVRSSRVEVGRGVSGRVAQSGQALLLSSAVDVQKYSGFVAKERTIFSALCVPLRARGAVIGVLSLDLMSPGPGFNGRDLSLASLFADNAAQAITARQLVDRAERQASEIETLRSASSALTATLDLEELAEAVLDRALALSGQQAGLLCLAGPDGFPFTVARYRNLPRDAVRATLASPAFRDFLVKAEYGLLPRPLSTSPVAALADALGNADVLVLPALPPEDENTGVLIVPVPAPVDGKLRLLRAFAPEAALAIGNAVLHRRVETKEEELETIVSSVPLPIVLVDAEARFRAINPAAAETFRLTHDFEAGQDIEGKLGDELEDMLLSEDEFLAREVVIRVAGMPKVFRASVTGVRLRGGTTGRVLVLYDVSAERELEQRKADFLAVLGHELRTPLTAIRGFTSTVLRNGDALDAQTRSDALQRVLGQAQRLERLIEDLLFVSRVEQNRPPLHLAWDDVVAVATDMVEEFRRREPDRPILTDASLPEMPVKMDRVKVEQIIYHLLDNALKYSEPGTPVRVTVKQEVNDIEISITDRGIGIFSGDLPRLFRAFGQLDGTATRSHGGTGVGLHVCKALADVYGGRIWAESVLGKGSTFVFTVPRVPPTEEVSD